MRYLTILGVCVLGAACQGQRSPISPSTSTISSATQTQSARATAPVEVTFTKWITTFPGMAGVTGGDVVGTFAGEVLSRNAFDNGVVVQLEARYEVLDPSGTHSFTALIRGTQNNETGTAVLNGVVTDGWLIGAQVHATFRVITPCAFGTRNVCFQGVIRVLPASAN
jgi:hypothetical protein